MNFIPGQDSHSAAPVVADDAGQDLSASLDQGDASFVSSEPKKQQVTPGTLGLFGVLALCGAGMYFMYVRNGPSAASAADVATADQVGAFLVDGEQHVKLMKQVLQHTDKAVLQFRQSASRTQVPLASLQTNPFRMEAIKPAAQQKGDADATSRRRREEERAAVVEAARAMSLQSILYGGGGRHAAVMIDGHTVTEGQEVGTLTVEKIEPDRVILRRGIYRVEKAFER